MLRTPALILPCALSLLLAFAAAPAAGGERSEFVAARDALADAYFDELDPDERDRLFEALGAYDHPEVINDVALVASRFGTYLDGLEGELARTHEKLAPFSQRQALTDQEVGLRNHYIRKIDELESACKRAHRSEEILVRAIGSFSEDRTLSSMLTQWERHPTWRVRQLLARACAHWHRHLAEESLSKRAFRALERLQRDDEVGVRVAVARSLVAFRRAEALEMLAKSLADKDWRVRAAAVAELKKVRTSETVGLLVDAMAKEEGRLLDDINNALRDLTGQNHTYVEGWAGWWASVGRKLPADGLDAPSAEAAQRAKDAAQFYGIPTRSERICFVIDVSGSMEHEVEQIRRVVITGKPVAEQPVEGKTRLEVAKNELKRAIGNLSSKKEFNIVFFSHGVKLWRDTMVRATPTAKKDARKDIEAVVASGATYTLGALREAFRLAGAFEAPGGKKKKEPQIDTIFVLSDGGPTDNKIDDAKPMDPDEILESVRTWNRDFGVVIHTIAVDTEDVGTYFLRQLAAQNGGIFVERKK